MSKSFIDFWPTDAKLIHVDINAERIDLTKRVEVVIQGDARMVAEQLLTRLSGSAGNEGRAERKSLIKLTRDRWTQKLVSMGYEEDTERRQGIRYDALTEALTTAVKKQINDGVTTFIEVVLNQELDEPFRRDAMTAPNKDAGISKADMQPQRTI